MGRWKIFAGLIVVMSVLVGCGGGDNGGDSSPVPTGSVVWEKTVGGAGNEEANSIMATADGGFVIVGKTTSFGAGADVYLVKFDALGEIVWQKTFSGSSGDYVAPTADGGYIVTGMTATPTGETGTRFLLLLIKTDAEGSLIWQRTYGPGDSNNGRFVFQNSDGGYTVAGTTNNPESDFYNNDLYILRVDVQGDVLSEYVSPTSNVNQSILAGRSYPDDTYDLAVYNNSVVNFYFSTVDIMKFDSQINLLETRRLAGVNNGNGTVTWTADGGYASTGLKQILGADSGAVNLIIFDSAGNQVVENLFGGSGGFAGPTLEQTADGGFLLAGLTSVSETPTYDVYLVRTDAAGVKLWELVHGGEGADFNGPIARLSDGGYVVAGSTRAPGVSETDLYILKVEESGIR